MITQELIVFVRAEITKGKSVEDIRKELLAGGAGWTNDDIDQVFGIVNPSTPPPTVSPQAIMPIQPFEVMPVQKPIEIKPKSSMGTILIILIILLLLGGAGWYFNLHTYLLSLVSGPAISTETPLAPSAEPKVQLKDINAETPVIINDSIPSISEEGIYTDTKNGFSITVPTGWNLENKKQQTETVAAFVAGNQTADLSQKIDISILDTSAVEADLDKYADTMAQVMPKIMAGYKLVSRNKINVNGTDMVLFDATLDYGEVMGKKMNGRIYQMYSLKNGKIYMIQAVVFPLSSWSKYEPEIKKSLLSFEFISN